MVSVHELNKSAKNFAMTIAFSKTITTKFGGGGNVRVKRNDTKIDSIPIMPLRRGISVSRGKF